MIAGIKALRAHCVDLIARIDAILPECEQWDLPATASRVLVVAGRSQAITQHAIDRYRERTGSKQPDEKVFNRIACRLANAREMELKPRFRAIELLAHGKPSRFFRDGDLMFVVEDDTVVTIHHGSADRWVPKP